MSDKLKELINFIIISSDKNFIINKFITELDYKELNQIFSALELRSNKLPLINLDFSNVKFKNNNIIFQIFKHLTTDTKINKLNLSNTNIQGFEDGTIKEIYKNYNNLSKLIAKYDNYHDENQYIINELSSLTKNKQLIKNPNEDIILNMLNSNKTLKSINISKNNMLFGPFIDCLLKSNNTTLTSLNIIDVFKTKHIEYKVKVSGWNSNSGPYEQIETRECDEINIDKYKNLIKLINKNVLQSLKLSFILCDYRKADKKIVNSFFDSIQNNKYLQKLKYSSHHSAHFNQYGFIKALKFNTSIKILNLKNMFTNNYGYALDDKNFNGYIFNYLFLWNDTLNTIIFNKNDKLYIREYDIKNEKLEFYNILKKEYNIELPLILHYDTVDMYNFIKNNTFNYIQQYNIEKNDNYYLIKIVDYINFIKNLNLNKIDDKKYKEYLNLLQTQFNTINITFK